MRSMWTKSHTVNAGLPKQSVLVCSYFALEADNFMLGTGKDYAHALTIAPEKEDYEYDRRT